MFLPGMFIGGVMAILGLILVLRHRKMKDKQPNRKEDKQ